MLSGNARRWFKDDAGNLRWRCPYYPDMSVPTGQGQGQSMPLYGNIDLAKYGKRVLLERIVRLLLAIKLSNQQWLRVYVDATRNLRGELPMCKAANDCLEKLMGCAQDAEPPVRQYKARLCHCCCKACMLEACMHVKCMCCLSFWYSHVRRKQPERQAINIKYGMVLLQGKWLILKGHLPTLVAALDWDGRMRPFLAELLQQKVLIAQVESCTAHSCLSILESLHGNAAISAGALATSRNCCCMSFVCGYLHAMQCHMYMSFGTLSLATPCLQLQPAQLCAFGSLAV